MKFQKKPSLIYIDKELDTNFIYQSKNLSISNEDNLNDRITQIKSEIHNTIHNIYHCQMEYGSELYEWVVKNLSLLNKVPFTFEIGENTCLFYNKIYYYSSDSIIGIIKIYM